MPPRANLVSAHLPKTTVCYTGYTPHRNKAMLAFLTPPSPAHQDDSLTAQSQVSGNTSSCDCWWPPARVQHCLLCIQAINSQCFTGSHTFHGIEKLTSRQLGTQVSSELNSIIKYHMLSVSPTKTLWAWKSHVR